ncbi:MAG: signal peptidase II [Planctomycetota bacterium]
MPDAAPSPAPAPPRPVPARRSGAAIARFLVVVAAVLAADLVLKYWAFDTVAGRPVVITDELLDGRDGHHAFWSKYLHEPIVVAPKLLELRLTTNTGAVFGLGKGNRVLFIAVSVVATAVIGWLFARSPARAWGLQLALALILAGALGNLYDRVVYRAVRDMLHLFPGVDLPLGIAWPGGITEVWPWIFNLADVALMVGVGFVLILTWRHDNAANGPARPASALRPPEVSTPSS